MRLARARTRVVFARMTSSVKSSAWLFGREGRQRVRQALGMGSWRRYWSAAGPGAA
jgi:hypothetical protein